MQIGMTVMGKKNFAARGMVCAGILLGAVSQANAATDDMPLGALASPPLGYIDMCARTPIYCVQTPHASESQLDAVRRWAGQMRWAVIFGQRLGVANPVVDTRAVAVTTTASVAAPATRHEAFAVSSLPTVVATPAIAEPATTTPVAPAVAPLARPWDLIRAAIRPKPEPVSPAAADPEHQPAVQANAVLPVVTTMTATSAPAKPADAWTPPRFFTDLGLDRLNEINRGVNRAIRPTSDQAVFGEADHWSIPTGRRASGDCEDYVLAKRQALIDAGAPAEALSIAVVETSRREIHAVLLVATSEGEVVLDNLSPWIVSWSKTSYRWLQRQAPGSALTWVQPAIGPGTA